MGIGVVCQYVDHDWCVFARRSGVVGSRWRFVRTGDGHTHRRHIGGGLSVRCLVGERVVSAVIGVRRVRDRVVGIYHHSAVRWARGVVDAQGITV